ncbi:MAG TPA: hypothetical protein VLY04_04405 [Bryobacteraceae bacterium]|nr:hypothetical protein [Bryobacteraceae bacterium]
MRNARPAIHRLAVAALLLCPAMAQTQALPAATALLDEAKAQAARDHRVIFAIFHASW